MECRRFDLQLARKWSIASGLGPGGGGGTHSFAVLFVELRDADGCVGRGEAAPSNRYQETVETCAAFARRVDPRALSFAHLDSSLEYLDALAPDQPAAKGAFEIALIDGAARRAGRPVCDWLGLGFEEDRHVTSFSIGLDAPQIIREKTLAAQEFPILKLKVGGPDDAENLRALRAAAPEKLVRVDANEAWKSKEEALRQIELLARDPRIEFVEQPMPAATAAADWAWLKARSPLPLMADESYVAARHIDTVATGFHAVNVKLVKAGGVTRAREALETARGAGLKTMLGCMIESSILITAAAHLANLTDYLDLDGNLLITNDPFRGVAVQSGRLTFQNAPAPSGLRVEPRAPAAAAQPKERR